MNENECAKTQKQKWIDCNKAYLLSKNVTVAQLERIRGLIKLGVHNSPNKFINKF